MKTYSLLSGARWDQIFKQQTKWHGVVALPTWWNSKHLWSFRDEFRFIYIVLIHNNRHVETLKATFVVCDMFLCLCRCKKDSVESSGTQTGLQFMSLVTNTLTIESCWKKLSMAAHWKGNKIYLLLYKVTQIIDVSAVQSCIYRKICLLTFIYWFWIVVGSMCIKFWRNRYISNWLIFKWWDWCHFFLQNQIKM